jgi:hypothetical protein
MFLVEVAFSMAATRMDSSSVARFKKVAVDGGAGPGIFGRFLYDLGRAVLSPNADHYKVKALKRLRLHPSGRQTFEFLKSVPPTDWL